ncbi:acetate--CoA ligase [Saccharolobus shibatae]|uniref:Acetate--CoA ligase n=1 Tax=Saccharolobus shibatae TaxID=2286 RepID=A0A8F5GY31_9CREN|nr:acetate--CoA ligase [Saccharolobus shibatae]QXJ30739.1 Acetyl-CoA synthetase [Saccharolobus shibatae]QXJ33764.1 Acetyl-CoA synthetase [Saccharolobus shibatae]
MEQEITENIKEIEEKVDYNIRLYKEIYRESIENPSKFWSKLAEELIDWFEPWKETFKQEILTKWFVGGKLNASYNAIDRHLNSSKKFKAAIIWESEKGERKVLTYQDLFYEVNRWANALKQLGVQKGDRVTIYMPLSPEGVIAMLACARIGAIHSVVFAGFGSQALADRIADAQSKIVITADGYYRKGRLVELKKTVDEALSKLQNNPVKNVIVFRRSGTETSFKEGRDIYFDEIGKKYRYVEPEPVDATHPLFILYTSGTTGKPKGIVHSTGGYLVGTAVMLLWSYGLSQENDVLFNTSDIGWIVGHSYITYSPLVMGRSVIIYESVPDYPYPDKWAELIEKYKATTFGTSATFLRYLMKYGEEYIKAHDLSSLRIMVTNGEPLNYAPWKYGLEVIGKGKVFMSHQWWQTETGAPNLGYMPGYPIFLTMKSGPASGYPLPGNKIKVVDENGNLVKPRERGYLIMEPPFPPSMMIGMWNDEGNERIIKTYFSKFPNLYYTGDFAMIDEDGYVWVSGRADETLKIAGHRIGAGEVESAITSHPAVAEAAVIGIPDPVKGETAHAFVVLKQGYHPSNELAKSINEHVKKVMGPIVILEVHFVNALPKTRSGKVMRRVIKAVMMGSAVGDISTLEDEASMEEIKKAIEALRSQLNP